MEPNIKTQLQKPTPPQTSQSGKKIIYTISIIVIIVFSLRICFWTINYIRENSALSVINSQNQSVPSSIDSDVKLFSKIKPNDYSLENLPVEESPALSAFDNDCLTSSTGQDARLINNDGRIIIPSIAQLISTYKRTPPSCETTYQILSSPIDGKYIYLKIHNISTFEYLIGKFLIYRIDLSDLSVKELFSNINNLYDSDFMSDNYKLLPNGKKIIGWDMNRVYLADLEKDTLNDLYISPKDQWLISRTEETELMTLYDYSVEVDENKITIGSYDKIESDKSRIGDENYLVENYKLIKRITIQIPAN